MTLDELKSNTLTAIGFDDAINLFVNERANGNYFGTEDIPL